MHAIATCSGILILCFCKLLFAPKADISVNRYRHIYPMAFEAVSNYIMAFKEKLAGLKSVVCSWC